MFTQSLPTVFQEVDGKKQSFPLGPLTNSSFSLHFLCINAFEMCQFNKVGSLDLSQWEKGMMTFCFRIKTKSTFCLVCSFFPGNTLDEELDFLVRMFQLVWWSFCGPELISNNTYLSKITSSSCFVLRGGCFLWNEILYKSYMLKLIVLRICLFVCCLSDWQWLLYSYSPLAYTIPRLLLVDHCSAFFTTMLVVW